MHYLVSIILDRLGCDKESLEVMGRALANDLQG